MKEKPTPYNWLLLPAPHASFQLLSSYHILSSVKYIFERILPEKICISGKQQLKCEQNITKVIKISRDIEAINSDGIAKLYSSLLLGGGWWWRRKWLWFHSISITDLSSIPCYLTYMVFSSFLLDSDIIYSNTAI